MAHELGERGTSLVRQPAVPEEELLDVLEFHDREIGRKGCLLAFFANNTKADVCFHDHWDIVATVADACNSLASRLNNLLCDGSLLERTATAYTDGFGMLCNIEELVHEVGIRQNDVKGCAGNHKHVRIHNTLVAVHSVLDFLRVRHILVLIVQQLKDGFLLCLQAS